MKKEEYDVDGRKVIVYYDNFNRALVSKEVLEELLSMASELKRLKREGEDDGK